MALTGSAKRVQEALEARGLTVEIKHFPEGTRTSEDAAHAIGCAVAQIAKSLIFRAQESGRPVLVIASGANRVDEKTIATAIGENIGRADADFVRQETGFAIGGVAPVGHRNRPITLIDEDLLELGEVWAAAGRPDSVFRLDATQLQPLTGGKVVRLAKR